MYVVYMVIVTFSTLLDVKCIQIQTGFFRKILFVKSNAYMETNDRIADINKY